MYIAREIEPHIEQFFKDREIIAIRGPRQSGKTTLLKKIEEQFVHELGRDAVHFLNFEDELEKNRFQEHPKDFIEFYLRDAQARRHVFFFDEVQYVKEAGKILKLIFDAYPHVKCFVSGSSTLDLAQLGTYLVGRVVFFTLYPFSFAEYLKARDERLYLEYQAHRFSLDHAETTSSSFLDRLNTLLAEYLTFGGYPRVALEPERNKKIILLKNMYSTYLEKDVSSLFGNQYREKVTLIVQYLSAIVGQIVNYNDIAQATGLYFKEVKQVLSILEETYVIARVPPYHKSLVTELKKNPKYYFLDLGLRNALLNAFGTPSDDEYGKRYENYAFLALREHPLAFWRTTAKAEVDFILKDSLIPLEVKRTPKITRSLLSFITHYHPKVAVIANEQVSGEEHREECRIISVPLCLL